MCSKPTEPKYTDQIIKWFWLTFAGVIGSIILLFIILSFTRLPTFDDLENPLNTFATEVLASDGTLIGRHFIQNRVQVRYDSLNPNLAKALIATEDERFMRHSGIDFQALGRVAIRTFILQQKSGGGGSTISQQLAKLLFSDRDLSGRGKISRTFRLVIIKFKEWITAVKIERRYTKEEIIAMYLNKFEFNNGAFGVQAASETYFGKNQSQLDVEEAAMLIGMLKNPSLYNPTRRIEIAQNRRNTVLNQMRKKKFITSNEYDSLKILPVDVSNFRRETHSEGMARYFLMEVRKEVQKILSNPEYRKPDGSEYNIYRDGLKVYTTIDVRIQKYAEEAMLEHMAVVQQRYNAEWKNRDPWTDGADSTQKALRAATLKSQIAQTDRYRELRAKYLDDIIEEIKQEFGGINLSDRDLEILSQKELTNLDLDELLKKKKINQNQHTLYKRVVNSAFYTELKVQFLSFQREQEQVFKTPINMKVFSYNPPLYEKDTLMSPYDSIRYHRMMMQSGVLAIEPTTGHIKAWVGGVNYKYFQYDHTRTNRQVGSTFKPFIYAAAITNFGISPCFPVHDRQYSIVPGEGKFGLIDPWTPKNSEGKFSGKTMNLYEGLRNSVNSVSVFLMKELGDTEPVRGMLHSMGIDSTEKRADGEYKLPKQPSISLGAADLNLMEMTGAYAVFANNGVYKKPIFIKHIEDHGGKVIYRSMEEETVALPAEANFAMLELLRNSASVLKYQGIKSDVGGKTGTTNEHVDGWFMGLTPGLVIGTWVGGEDRWIRYRTFSNGQGSRMARPIFYGLLKRLEDDTQVDYDYKLSFISPPEPRTIITDCSKYKRSYSGFKEEDDEIDDEFKLEEF
jgi:penicillin-binding protein 1A